MSISAAYRLDEGFALTHLTDFNFRIHCLTENPYLEWIFPPQLPPLFSHQTKAILVCTY